MARILIVDDEASIRFATSNYLSACGHHVDVSDGVDSAVARLATAHYELVIADVRLSGALSYDGLEILDVIRARWPETRVVFLTAYASSLLDAKLIERGASAVIQKPTPLAEVARLASELVGDRG